MKRRLAAVLMTDVVGYSRLMEADEAGTVAALRDLRQAVLEPVVAAHGGRIVKLIGDGVLAEFGSAVNAVAGAVELQRRIAEANADTPVSRRIVVRIGINLGDVIAEGDDIYGDGVNIAARLEAIAEPGGICISAKVHDEVAGKLAPGIAFDDLGERTVKNIARPVRVFQLRREGAGAAKGSGGGGNVGAGTNGAGAGPGDPVSARPAPSLPDKPSIAVLPFQNMSGDPEQDYFADGMVEEIITALSRMRWLFVIARNSSFIYKGRAVDVKQVGRELGVRYVLEGSVRKAGSRVRVTSQLIDAGTGAHLWADRFDGKLADVFDLQDQVTERVIGWIAPRLEQAEIQRAQSKPTDSLDAYDTYLRGLAAFNSFNREGNAEALALFLRAGVADPGFAAAHGMAARCYVQRIGFGWVADRVREAAEASRLARQAAEVGRDDAIALCAAGSALVVVVGDLADGPALIDRALAIDPNLAWAWHFSAFAKTYLGEPEAAIERADHAMRLSPQDPQMFGMLAASALARFLCGRDGEALSWAEAALRERPNFVLASCVIAASAALADRPVEAEKAMAHLRHLNPALRLSNIRELTPLQRDQDLKRWTEGLRRAGLPE